jgi:hypothetical protein
MNGHKQKPRHVTAKKRHVTAKKKKRAQLRGGSQLDSL